MQGGRAVLSMSEACAAVWERSELLPARWAPPRGPLRGTQGELYSEAIDRCEAGWFDSSVCFMFLSLKYISHGGTLYIYILYMCENTYIYIKTYGYTYI